MSETGGEKCVCGWPITEYNKFNHVHCTIRVDDQEALTIRTLRSHLATITEERDTLLASLKEVMEYPDCLTIEHKSSELDRAIKAIEEVEK